MVEAKKTVRHYTRAEQADLDIKTSENKIGEIVNLSQELNTQLWDKINHSASFESVEELYCDISKLDVLSGIEIDKAKKEFVVNSTAEIKRLKTKYSITDDDGRKVKPNFFGRIDRGKGYYNSAKKKYRFHDTTMDYLQHAVNRYHKKYGKPVFIPFSDLLLPKSECVKPNSISYVQVNDVLDAARKMKAKCSYLWIKINKRDEQNHPNEERGCVRGEGGEWAGRKKSAPRPKPGNGAALNKVYHATS